jgi:hypothetical protein
MTFPGLAMTSLPATAHAHLDQGGGQEGAGPPELLQAAPSHPNGKNPVSVNHHYL